MSLELRPWQSAEEVRDILLSEHAPEGLRAQGILSLRNRPVRSIPKNLTVEGNLSLRHCDALQAIGSDLRVAGDANFAYCTALESIGEGLDVGGWLKLEGNEKLSCLPSRWRAEKISLDTSVDLERFFGGRDIPCELWLDGNARWPDELRVAGLQLTGFGKTVRMPSRLIVTKKLHLESIKGLREIPTTWSLHGSVTFYGLDDLGSLPAGFRVQGDLSLGNCGLLRALPGDLRVDGLLSVYDSSGSLCSIGEGLHASSISLKGCYRLQEIGDGFTVDGDADLTGCESLTSLPRGMRIGGTLDLSRCKKLENLPADLQVGGNLKLGWCKALGRLPASVARSVRGKITPASRR